ncbi:hypothetical protein GUJ93_ZPchr0003g16754 [Zizania palustris]|uniref:Uncharacterized protein n=1 Tax=Zizania palustris TaxID=103762 RepID=A0A8J5SUK6_ZIZPA|nr:hypothetical protein GUJ93_ZPchr0003g16754 [Zizania palustris]
MAAAVLARQAAERRSPAAGGRRGEATARVRWASAHRRDAPVLWPEPTRRSARLLQATSREMSTLSLKHACLHLLL